MTEPMITYWCGKDIRELSREELMAAIESMGKMLDLHLTRRAMKARAIGEVELMRRGIWEE